MKPFSVLLAALFCCGSLAAQPTASSTNARFAPPAAGKRVVYRHANLIDGTGAPLRADMAVLVDGDTIRAVLPDSQLSPGQLQGAESVDLGGRYLLPGLIDSHEHVATPPNRRAAEAWLRRDL